MTFEILRRLVVIAFYFKCVIDASLGDTLTRCSSPSVSGITNPTGGDEVRGGGAGGTSPMKVRQSPKKCAHCGILHPMDLIR